MKEQILKILESYTENIETQSGVKGNIIWDEDFKDIIKEITKIIN